MPNQSFRTNIPEVDQTEIEDNRTAIDYHPQTGFLYINPAKRKSVTK